MQILPKTFFPFVWHFIKPYKSMAILYMMLALIAGFWGPLNSLIIKNIINNLPQISDENISPIILPAFLIVVNFIVFDNFTWRGIGLIEYKYFGEIKNEIIKSTMNYVNCHSHQFFQEHLSGKISNQITQLADRIYRILCGATPNLLRGGSLIVIALVTTFFVNPIFSLIILIWAVLFILISLYMSQKLIALGDKYAAKESEISGQVVDCISNQSNIRIFANRDYETKRLRKYLQSTLDSFKKKELHLVLMHATQGGLIAIMMAFSSYFFLTYTKKD